MENLIFLLATALTIRFKSISQLKRHFIGNSGCSVLLPGNPDYCQSTITEEGDHLFLVKRFIGNVVYGVVHVELKKSIEQGILVHSCIQFFNNIRKAYKVSYNTGVHTHFENEILIATDYWQDEKGIDWKVQGFSEGNQLSFLFIKNINELDVKKQDAFFNSLILTNKVLVNKKEK